MKHLTDAECIDLLDGTLAATRGAHAADCAQCQARMDTLRVALAHALLDRVPEPSPLFWDHFSARVSNAIGDDASSLAPVTWRNWPRHPALRWVAAASCAILVMIAVAWRLTPRGTLDVRVGPAGEVGAQRASGNAPTRAADAASQMPSSTPAMLLDEQDVEADESWAIVRTAAEDLAWDEALAAGLTARPGSADRVALQLTGEEREALARLLQSELKRRGV